MWYSVDRIEPCGCAVLISDTGERCKLSPKEIGFCPKEGDVLVRGEDGVFSLDSGETESRRKRLDNMLKRILRRNR